MAIRNFAPTYCNTCVHFDLEKAARERTALFCTYREMTTEWDHRACVLYMPVSDGQRQVRRAIVVQLHNDKKGKAGAEANNTPEAGQ